MIVLNPDFQDFRINRLYCALIYSIIGNLTL